MTLPPSSVQEHPHRRLNPLTGEWILVSPQRSNRPWQGATQTSQGQQGVKYDADCYLCPGNQRKSGGANPSYLHTFVFDNDFPALDSLVAKPTDGDSLFISEAVQGACKVICYSPDHARSMAQMSVEEIASVVSCWQNETEVLNRQFEWVQLFENKGESMGCSSPHPHCQVWATSYLPQIPQQEDQTQKAWFQKNNMPLLLEIAERESEIGDRVVVENDDWLVIVPYWAAWPFETLLLPKFPVTVLSGLSVLRRTTLAQTLSELSIRYDNLFECSFPYSMGWHGAPGKGEDVSYWQLHAHFFPPLLRSATVKKFMVGFEMLAETQRDLTPEQAAERLRSVDSIHYLSTQVAD
jgi:UDPglucose--hexose-1-phosphate uridylyltransferase